MSIIPIKKMTSSVLLANHPYAFDFVSTKSHSYSGPGIYSINNLRTDRIYIGQSACIVPRWQAHRNNLRTGKHTNLLMQHDFDKYTESDFVFTLIDCLSGNLQPQEQAIINEIATTSPGRLYNQSKKIIHGAAPVPLDVHTALVTLATNLENGSVSKAQAAARIHHILKGDK